jgi:hypothetical protein
MLFFRACDERARESHEDSCFFELDTIARDRRAAIASSLLRHAPRARMREYTRALQAVAARTAYNEQRVRAAGARYFARYSGAFADAKRATIAQNDTTALYARRDEASRYCGAEVTPSNFASFVALDKVRMLGDAEIAREETGEWHGRATRGYTPIDVPLASTWHELFRASGVDVTQQHAVAAPVEAHDATSSPVAAEVTRVSCSTLEGILARSSLPVTALTRMFSTLGLDVQDARETIRIYLTTWRDVNAADAAALAHLMHKAR